MADLPIRDEMQTAAVPVAMTGNSETAPHDAALRAAIVAAASTLRFDNRPGSVQRQFTLGLFVAALSDRLALSFPQSAEGLKAVVFSPSTTKNPVATDRQQ